MIKNISVINFRCFDNLKVSGFKTINLISGKNNVGKTALLEALFLNSSPRPDTILSLQKVRKEQSSFSRALPDRTWNNFFFNQDKNNTISIEADLKDESSKIIEIYVDESVKDFLEDSYQEDDDEKENFFSLFSGSESVVSVIHIKARTNSEESFETLIVSSAKGLVDKRYQSSRY
jgi:AAA15 family ATPase/GTPase